MSENLVVVSKLKSLIKQKSGMNTSAGIVDPLNKMVEEEVEKAIKNAEKARRRTVMERDFESDGSDSSFM